MANLKQEPVLDLDGHVVRDARKPKKAAALDRDAEIARLNEKIEFLSRTNMLYSDWEHRDAQVTSDLIRKGIEEAKINVQLRAKIESLKAQLAQPAQEPVAWRRSDKHRTAPNYEYEDGITSFRYDPSAEPLYTAPPQREWVGLTDEERSKIWGGIIKYAPSEMRIKDFAQAIEAKLKEKNT